MAKPSQTFKKRQRENKLREKAQLKRERRQQRQTEKKALQATPGNDNFSHHEPTPNPLPLAEEGGPRSDG
jgi:hypothetical protein